MGRHSRRRRHRSDSELLRKLWGTQINPDTSDLIAIDPGDRWTGVAFFKEEEDGWYCQDAVEMSREEFEDAFCELIMSDDRPRIVIYEKFRLYEDKALLQTGSEFDTSQLIGVIKFIVRVHNDHAKRHALAQADHKMLTCELEGGACADPSKPMLEVQLVKQPADIKKPTRGILRYKKIKSVAKPISKELYENRDHVVDAELHGWKHILDTLDGKPSSL